MQHDCICACAHRERCLRAPAIPPHFHGGLQNGVKRMLSSTNHSSKSRDLQPGRHTHKGKKSSVRKGGTCPVLPCCRKASLPSPPPRKGGCRGPQHGGSCTTFEMSLSTVLPPPEWFPSAGSLPSAPVPDWRATTSVGCCCVAPAFLYISVWRESSGRSLGSGDKKVDSSKRKHQKKQLQSRRVSRFKQIQQKQMIM